MKYQIAKSVPKRPCDLPSSRSELKACNGSSETCMSKGGSTSQHSTANPGSTSREAGVKPLELRHHTQLTSSAHSRPVGNMTAIAPDPTGMTSQQATLYQQHTSAHSCPTLTSSPDQDELIQQELQQALARLRRLQSAIAREESELVHSAVEATHLSEPKLEPKPTPKEERAARRVEAAMINRLKLQIEQANARLEATRGELQQMLSDDRFVLALAVKQGVDEYYSEKQQLYHAKHLNEMGAAAREGSGVGRLRHEEQRLKEALRRLASDSAGVMRRKAAAETRRRALCDSLRAQEQTHPQ